MSRASLQKRDAGLYGIRQGSWAACLSRDAGSRDGDGDGEVIGSRPTGAQPPGFSILAPAGLTRSQPAPKAFEPSPLVSPALVSPLK
jgi:hypothetical protein